jgi:hypothetical protein
MDSDQKLPGFLANRSVSDRRTCKIATPPYATGTGVVLIERRSGNDRRATASQSQVTTDKPGKIDAPVG